MIPETHSFATWLGLFLTATAAGAGWVLGCWAMGFLTSFAPAKKA